MNFNKAIILGRVTNQPEMRSLPSGQNVTSFGIATNRVWKDAQGNKKEDTQFHNVVLFGKLADTAGKYIQKGSLILVEGRIQYRSWEGQDGQKRFRTEIVGENMQLGPRAMGGGAQPSPQSTPKKKAGEEVPTVSEDDVNIEEDIPF